VITDADVESAPADEPVELTMSVNTMRVAIKSAMTDDVPFVVQPLKAGEPIPEGAMEAMLVLTGEGTGSGMNRSQVSREYRAIEAWLGRYGTVINHHGKRALRLLASVVTPG